MNIFYGINTVKNLIKYKCTYIEKIFLCLMKKNIKLMNLKKIILYKKINLVIFSPDIFKKKFNKLNVSHQGIIVFVKKKIFNFKLNDFLNKINKKNSFFLVLNNIMNPYNLGACIRIAVAAGINGIIVSKNNTVSIENSIVHKTSSGSIYKIFIFQFSNILNIINIFKNKKYFIVGTTIENYNNIFNYNFSKINSLVLVLGSEDKGIKKSIKKKCDILINIPIKNINSLNLSVACGISVFEILRQKKLF